MPDWTNYSFHYTTGTSANSDTFAISDVSLSMAQVQQQYEEWIRECEQQDRMIEQQIREAKEREADKRKYPLFFLKGGIV